MGRPRGSKNKPKLPMPPFSNTDTSPEAQAQAIASLPPLKLPQLKPVVSTPFIDNTKLVPVQGGVSAPPPNIVELEGGNAHIPLSQLMAENSEICCPICGNPLPSEERQTKTVVIAGQKWMACKGCYATV